MLNSVGKTASRFGNLAEKFALALLEGNIPSDFLRSRDYKLTKQGTRFVGHK